MADILKGDDPIGGTPFTFFSFDSLIHLLIKVFGSTCHQRDDGMIWREHDAQNIDDFAKHKNTLHACSKLQ